MATFEITNTETIERILRQFGDSFDEIAVEMLEETSPILAKEVLVNLPKEIEKYSVKQTIMKPKKKNDGWVCYINWKGVTKRSKDNLRNAELMAYWEYGSTKNRPTGFMRKSISNSRNDVQSKMSDIAHKKLEELGR